METRPKRELLTFSCPNDKEYCFLQKKRDGKRICATYHKSIYFMCRYTQPIKTKVDNG